MSSSFRKQSAIYREQSILNLMSPSRISYPDQNGYQNRNDHQSYNSPFAQSPTSYNSPLRQSMNNGSLYNRTSFMRNSYSQFRPSNSTFYEDSYSYRRDNSDPYGQEVRSKVFNQSGEEAERNKLRNSQVNW